MSDRCTPCRMIAALACAVVCCLTAVLDAEDWPQWRGIDRAAVWHETGIVERFAEGGLIVKWRTPVRAGFAGPAVADGRVFVLDYQETPGSRTMDGHERLVALDEETGAVLWTRQWPATYRNIVPVFATGPRATPTVDGDRVYILGAAGMLSCFDTTSGDLIWKIDAVADYGVTVPVYGVAHSPVESEHLITLLGGEPDAMVVAFDKGTGAEAWRAIDTNSEAGYSSPIVLTAGGVRQLIVWHPAGVTSLDPATGRIWWEHDFPLASGLTIGTPVRSGRYLLITQVENGGLMLALNPDRPAARLVWTGTNPNRTDRPVQRSMTSTPIVVGDVIYGQCRGLRGISLRRRIKCFGKSKVQHLYRAVVSDVDVGRFEITMNDASLMSCFQCLCYLFGNGQRFIDSNRPLRDPVRQSRSLDQFQHQRPGVVGLLQTVDGCDARMVQAGENLRFALEAGKPIRVRGKRLGQDLQRDLPVELGIGGLPHFAHPTFTELGGDRVMTEEVDPISWTADRRR